jgi:hypothetical protein
MKECLAGAEIDRFAIESASEAPSQEVQIAVVFVGMFGGGNAGGIDDLKEEAFFAVKAKPRSPGAAEKKAALDARQVCPIRIAFVCQ